MKNFNFNKGSVLSMIGCAFAVIGSLISTKASEQQMKEAVAEEVERQTKFAPKKLSDPVVFKEKGGE